MDSFQRIFAACRYEPAARRFQRGNVGAVKTDRSEKNHFHFFSPSESIREGGSILHESCFAPQREDRLFGLSVGHTGQKGASEEHSFVVPRELMPMKPVHFLHQAAGPVPRKCVADLLGRHKPDADGTAVDFHHIEKSGAVAETFAAGVNPAVVPISADPGLTAQCIPLFFPVHLRSGREDFSALCSSSLQNDTACAGLHASAESVGTFSPGIVRLECHFGFCHVSHLLTSAMAVSFSCTVTH